MSGVHVALIVAACLFAGCAVVFAIGAWLARRARIQRRIVALDVPAREKTLRREADARHWVLDYAEGLNRRLFVGTTEAITPCVRAKRAGSTHAGSAY